MGQKSRFKKFDRNAKARKMLIMSFLASFCAEHSRDGSNIGSERSVHRN